MIIDFDKAYPLSATLQIEKLSSIYYYDFTKDFVFNGERHNYWEFVYVDSGEIIASAEDTDFFLKQGEIIFHKPNEFHKLRCNGINAPNVVVITFHSHSPSLSFFKNKHMKVPDEYRWIMSKIIEEDKNFFIKNTIQPKESPVFAAEQLIKNYLEIFLLYLMRENSSHVFFSEKNISENRIVCSIINIMEDQLFSQIDIPYLCQKLGYSKTYLCTLFKKHTNTSIMGYYMQMKIKKAKQLLREKNHNITEISEMLDFNNSHYFSHVFSKYAGMSPRNYMKSVNE